MVNENSRRSGSDIRSVLLLGHGDYHSFMEEDREAKQGATGDHAGVSPCSFGNQDNTFIPEQRLKWLKSIRRKMSPNKSVESEKVEIGEHSAFLRELEELRAGLNEFNRNLKLSNDLNTMTKGKQ